MHLRPPLHEALVRTTRWRLAAIGALTAAMALAPALSAAQIYKWVDAQGVTHYTSDPPPGSAKSKTLPLQNSTGPASSSASAPSWQEKDSAFQARFDKHKADEAKKDKDDAARALARRDACNRGRDQLHVADVAPRLYTLDAQGERVYMSDQERDRSVAELKANIERNCGG